jgi:hypothetical protein
MRIEYYEYNVTTKQCIAEQCHYELEQVELETFRKYSFKNKKYTPTNNPNKDRDKNPQYQYLLKLFNYCTH